MTSAFDTVDRIKLLNVCQSFLDDDDVRLIRVLLSNTSLKVSCSHLLKRYKRWWYPLTVTGSVPRFS